MLWKYAMEWQQWCQASLDKHFAANCLLSYISPYDLMISEKEATDQVVNAFINSAISTH